MTAEAAERQLAALGYEGPQSALTHLAALTSHSGRRGRVQQVLLPTLLDWLSDTPDPDAGLLAYRRISEELSDQRWYPVDAARRRRGGQAADAGAGHVGLRARTADAGAGGHPAVRRRTARPQAARRRARTRWRGHWSRRPRGMPIRCAPSRRPARCAVGSWPAIASADLLGMLEVADVCKALTSVWVAVLQAALDAVIRANTPDGGEAPARIAVIGMGRLGGGELGYGSDADVMFVCEPDRRCRRVGRGAMVDHDRRAGAGAAGHAERRPAAGGRRRPAAGGPQRLAGAHACLRMRRTTRSGRSRGRFRRCCGRTGWRATRTSASGSC